MGLLQKWDQEHCVWHTWVARPLREFFPRSRKKKKGEDDARYDERIDAFNTARDKISRLLDRQYKPQGANWKLSSDVTFMLGQALAKLIKSSEIKGLKLIDTMRTGSDYWRPGNVLTNAVNAMSKEFPNQAGPRIEYGRFDELCPSGGTVGRV